MSVEIESTRRGVLTGVSRALPIVLGYVPIGLAYGVLAQKAGLSALNTLLMSLIVYAGSAQLIAVGLFAGGASPLSIILTTFVVNLRHLLFSAAVAPFLQHWRKIDLAGFAYELTDETFAVHSAQFASEGVPGRAEVFATNVTAQVSWVFGTALGILVGQVIADVKPLGLDYALPAMFIALLVLQIKERVQIVIALLAGMVSVGLLLAGLDQWNVIVATVIVATLGVALEQWNKK
ncbi:MAG: AzlC family ABC transporter permease [Anaerolineae bacterium]